MNIATCVLQGKDKNLLSAMQTIEECKRDIERFKETYSIKRIEKDLQMLNSQYGSKDVSAKRKTHMPSYLHDSIIDCRIQIEEQNQGPNKLRQTLVEVCDSLCNELAVRFGKDNISKWISMQALSPMSDDFLDSNALMPLFEYAKSVPSITRIFVENSASKSLLEAECRIFKSKIEKYFNDSENNTEKDPINRITAKLLEFYKTNGTPVVLATLYKLAVTAGYTQSKVESMFSAAKRTDSCHRRSQLVYRKASLSFLHFEKQVTREITFDEFLVEWKRKPRALNF